jgi:hypothetical protein
MHQTENIAQNCITLKVRRYDVEEGEEIQVCGRSRRICSSRRRVFARIGRALRAVENDDIVIVAIFGLDRVGHAPLRSPLRANIDGGNVQKLVGLRYGVPRPPSRLIGDWFFGGWVLLALARQGTGFAP